MEKQEIDGIIQDTVFIFDTNVWLYLYKCSFNTSNNLVQLITKVRDNVIIPYRVSEEYEKHKKAEQSRIDRKYDNFTKDIKKRIDTLKNDIAKSITETRKYDFPNANTLEMELFQKFEDAIHVVEQYDISLSAEKGNKSLQIESVELLVNWIYDHKQVTDKPSMPEIIELIKEGELRYRYRIPPGYMDEEEKDKEWKADSQKDNFIGRIRKYGDFFVWKDILAIAINRFDGNKNIVFVTNDTKEDWWENYSSTNSQPVEMRGELADEYKQVVGNDRVHFLTLRSFYELFSDYYKVQDIKTQLELDYDAYVKNHVLHKYRNDIDAKVHKHLHNLEWDNLIGEENVEISDVDYDDFEIEDVNIHYDNDMEYAIYDIHVNTNTYPVFVTAQDPQGNNRLLKVIELYLSCMLIVRRDLRNLEEDEMEIETVSSDISSEKDSFEYWLEEEENSRAEYYDSLETKNME